MDDYVQQTVAKNVEGKILSVKQKMVELNAEREEIRNAQEKINEIINRSGLKIEGNFQETPKKKLEQQYYSLQRAVHYEMVFWKDIPTVILLFWSIGFKALFFRLTAILTSVFRDPVGSFASIPENWTRVALAMDSCCPPEALPGYHLRGATGAFRIPEILKVALSFLGQRDFRLGLFGVLIFAPLIILLYLPPLTYRWCLKATAIIYTPLLWIVWVTFRRMADFSDTLERIRKSDLTRIVVLYSAFVILGFVAKFVLMLKWSNFVAWWNMMPLTEFLAIYAVSAEIPLWQVAAFINACWAIGIFVFAKEALMRTASPESWPPTFIERVLRISSFGRSILSVYVIICTAYITIQAATTWNLPTLGTKWFPW